MSARAAPPAEPRPPLTSIRSYGGFTFAEDPARAAPEARIIWRAALDPGTLSVTAVPADPAGPDSILVNKLAPWLSIVRDAAGHEHAALSDGYHHIRLDVAEGSIATGGAVLLHYHLSGLASAEAKILPLRRLLHLCRRNRFARSLFPPDPWIERWVTMLRVHDALAAGVSQREIAIELFGEDRVDADWAGRSESLRNRVRRLAREARTMAAGAYRFLLRRAAGKRDVRCGRREAE